MTVRTSLLPLLYTAAAAAADADVILSGCAVVLLPICTYTRTYTTRYNVCLSRDGAVYSSSWFPMRRCLFQLFRVCVRWRRITCGLSRATDICVLYTPISLYLSISLFARFCTGELWENNTFTLSKRKSCFCIRIIQKRGNCFATQPFVCIRRNELRLAKFFFIFTQYNRFWAREESHVWHIIITQRENAKLKVSASQSRFTRAKFTLYIYVIKREFVFR